jgi:CheY-like chemotaxis protein
MATILVVDDIAMVRAAIKQTLLEAGHTVLEAADGADALEIAQARRPDLIISDILMPIMDGYDLARRLRTLPELANVPVVFCTSHSQNPEARALAKICGVSHVLGKPPGRANLLDITHSILEGRGRRKLPRPD